MWMWLCVQCTPCTQSYPISARVSLGLCLLLSPSPKTLSRVPSFLESNYKIDTSSLWEGLYPTNPMWLLLYGAQHKSFSFYICPPPLPQYQSHRLKALTGKVWNLLPSGCISTDICGVSGHVCLRSQEGDSGRKRVDATDHCDLHSHFHVEQPTVHSSICVSCLASSHDVAAPNPQL